MISKEIKEYTLPDMDRIVAIYFIYVSNELVYIGQTVNLHTRVMAHMSNKVPDMDSVLYHEIDESRLIEVETALIRYYSPERNGIDNLKQVLSPTDVKREINIINEFIDNPEFKPTNHISLLQHTMYLKFGESLYKEAYNKFVNDYTLNEKEKIVEMKRYLR